MEQNPSEVNRATAGQKIPNILWYLKVHYCKIFNNNPQGHNNNNNPSTKRTTKNRQWSCEQTDMNKCKL
jgi:hypothetical protein